MHRDNFFGRFAKSVAHACGSSWAFICALLIVVVWLVSGPFFGFSETWQLIINTGTTIITFLMVFIIQNTQNKDTAAIQLKLDELIRATEHAHNALMDLEEFREDELEKIRERYLELAETARQNLRAGKTDANKPDAKEDFDLMQNAPQR